MAFQLADYLLVEKLSEYPDCTVYRGRRVQDNLPVILKVLNQRFPTSKSLAQFRQEFEILRMLDFPGVEKVSTFENHKQNWVMVLEDFGGRPIDQLGVAGKMAPEEFLDLALQLTEIMDKIHARKVIHKNISPVNIMLNLSNRQVRLTNFENASLLSRERTVLGNLNQQSVSLAYISPEMTGRMDRSVDYRTDYYSLGATLYELLTGSPPFVTQTPLELVHAILAFPPDPPASRIKPWKTARAAFQILSDILLKLLSKNPQERYQTASALRADLQFCQASLQKSAGANQTDQPRFVPGLFDHPGDLKIPQTMVGREQEIEALVQAFTRTIGGHSELVVVAGEAGVGKTTLVRQLIPLVMSHKGFFLYGNYYQTGPHYPYAVMSGVLDEFCRFILSQPVQSFNDWRARIQSAVAPYGQLLINLNPEFEKIIGPQPPIPMENEPSSHSRMHQLMVHFLKVMCQPEHPAVLILDDYHFANKDSFVLYRSILLDPSIQNLLLVVCFRDEEVGIDHPLRRMIRELEASQAKVSQLFIPNLDYATTRQLVQTILTSSANEMEDLLTLVYTKTEGNPHFIIELLKSVYKDRLLDYDPKEQRWHWNAEKIEEQFLTSNLVDLVYREITDQEEDTQKILLLAALIGKRFDTATLLALAGKENAARLADGLWLALNAGLIEPIDANYRFLAGEYEDARGEEVSEKLPRLADLLEEGISFQFQHASIQLAAAATLDEQQKKKLHLQIGWLLLEKAERQSKESVYREIYVIVDHLNQAKDLIDNPKEASKAASLNLMAGKRARATCSYELGLYYVNAGIQLLPGESWHNEYDFSLEIYSEGAEIALQAGDLARAEALALEAEAHSRTPLEKIRLIETRMNVCIMQNQLDKIVELGFAAIKLIGFDLVHRQGRVLEPDQYFQLPEMKDPKALAISGLADLMISASLSSNHISSFYQFTQFFLDLFSVYGNPPEASFAYITHGITLVSRFEQLEKGFQIGKNAWEKAEKQASPKILSMIRFVYYAYVYHLAQPAREELPLLHENIKHSILSETPFFSMTSQQMEAMNSLLVGSALEEVRTKQADALQRFMSLNESSLAPRLKIWSNVVLVLMGKTDQPYEKSSDLLNDGTGNPLKEADQNQGTKFYLYFARVFMGIFFRDPRTAVESAFAADLIKECVLSQLIFAHHLFFSSLALLSAELDPGDLAARLKKVEENLSLMRLWAGQAPENFRHHLELVEAEKARFLGQEEKAIFYFNRAIEDASQNGYIHESGLAAELAAEFDLARGDYFSAKDHLYLAYYAYLEWGAMRKAEDLANCYPEFLPPGKDDKIGVYQRWDGKINTLDAIASSIDLNTILKASLEMANETSLSELQRKLMLILIENAGAQYGALILRSDNNWLLKARVSTDPQEPLSLASVSLGDQAIQVGEPQVPVSIIYYVINSRTSLVHNDISSSNLFKQDDYVQARRPRSILCTPLLSQGVLGGVVYLENNFTTGAFTPDRLQVVQFIANQAAVSIDKARMYEKLEALVAERTYELSETNEKLKTEIKGRLKVEDALRVSEERYRKLFANTGTAMALIGSQKRTIALVNEEFVRLTGYSKQELEDHFDFLQLVSPADLPRVSRYKLNRFNHPSKAPHSYEFRLIDRKGTEKAVINKVTALPKTQQVIVSLIDISQRKLTEQALEESEARLRIAFDAAHLVPLNYKFLTEQLVQDERVKEIFGVHADEYLNYAEIIERIHPEDRKLFEQAVLKAAERESGGGIEQEIRILWPDGSVHWIAVNGRVNAAVGIGRNEPPQLVGVIQDVTERKNAEEMLRYNETLLRKMLELVPVGIWFTDPSHQIILANPEAERIWAGAKYVALGEYGEYKAWWTDNGKRVENDEWAEVLAINKRETTLNDELEIEAFDGTHRFILNSSIPIIIEDDRLVGAIVVNQDITQHKQNEAALQKAYDQLSILLNISQNIVTTFDLDRLLISILDQIEKVLPFEGAAILIVEEGSLKFRSVRGPSIFNSVLNFKVPIDEPILVRPIFENGQPFYVADLRTDVDLVKKMWEFIPHIPDQILSFRCWLGQPLIANEAPIGMLILVHSQPDIFPRESRDLLRAIANQVAIAILNAQLYRRAQEIAAMQERNRLARELHDSVAQALYSISLFTDATRLALKANKLEVVKNHLDELVQLSQEAIYDMRLMIYELRPPILARDGLVAALHNRLESVEVKVGFHTEVIVEGDLHLPSNVEDELYRIAQEALNNVVKHAQADLVEINLKEDQGKVTMIIKDTGVGFELEKASAGGGLGIRNIKERAERIGASCSIQSAPGQGTIITIQRNA